MVRTSLYRYFRIDPSAGYAPDGDDVHRRNYARSDSRETRLWRAVLLRTWADALAVSIGDNCETTPEERDEARRWLTSQLDPWREDRNIVCALSGFDGDECRRRAIALLADTLAAERVAEAQYVETTFAKMQRLRLLRRAERAEFRPATAAEWLAYALTTGSDEALLKAAELELIEIAA